MNELLGWYGYDNVDRIDLQGKHTRIPGPMVNSVENSFRNDSNNSNSHHDTSGAPSHDSSREDSRSPSSTKNYEKIETLCGWCKRLVPQNSPDFLATPEGPRYCSESCFAQSRRASFKRAKTCDWCRHVRHAVSYVDFQDGASQLQFCSDKCLNQYKMQIFCKETQAHLDMNPHLKDKGVDTTGALITPDLWLKNCRSRSATPEHSDVSRSSTPTQKNSMSQQLVHKPVISVAPPSKLLSRTQLMESTRQSPKHNRKKRFTRLNIGHNSAGHNGSGSGGGGISNCNSSIPKVGVENVNNNQSSAAKPCTFTNVQDLRMNIPPVSPIDSTLPPRVGLSSPFFSGLTPGAFNVNQPFLNNHPHPRLLGLNSQSQILPIPGADFASLFSAFGTTPPPVTVMVPYPIIVPLPIPIPVPLPITDFIKAAESRKNGAMPSQKGETETSSHEQEEYVEPLDCSKSKPLPPEPDDVEKSSTSKDDSLHSLENHNSDDIGDKDTLPKLKITRLNSKRAIMNPPRESESSRPLRKRKRVIDCDYVKASKEFDDKNKSRK
ncbi:unnamed protein product [Hermetia illucens]|uniref:Sine oculis-binding protein-like protein n=2 Tax=Hermetia illucens TaxID=343691 RepID=A0A7R8YWY2_HERIL|nr:unnamed protein product [Hermetia illucens]